MTDDPFNTREYQQFCEEMAEHCRCKERPCPGVLAGGLCDSAFCDEHEYEEAEYYGDDNE